jgi:hypothetical protein
MVWSVPVLLSLDGGAMIVGLLLFLLEVQFAISQNPRRYY